MDGAMIIYTVAVYLAMALPIVVMAILVARRTPRKRKVLVGFLVYGFLSGVASAWWWTASDMPWLANLPGEVAGNWLHSINSGLFPLPLIFVPASIGVWGVLGLIVQEIYRRKR